MISWIKEVISGWWNLLTKNKKMTPLAKKRLAICKRCSLNTNGVCDSSKTGKAVRSFIYRGKERRWLDDYNGCNCPINAKVNSPSSQCPLGKW